MIYQIDPEKMSCDQLATAILFAWQNGTAKYCEKIDMQKALQEHFKELLKAQLERAKK